MHARPRRAWTASRGSHALGQQVRTLLELALLLLDNVPVLLSLLALAPARAASSGAGRAVRDVRVHADGVHAGNDAAGNSDALADGVHGVPGGPRARALLLASRDFRARPGNSQPSLVPFNDARLDCPALGACRRHPRPLDDRCAPHRLCAGPLPARAQGVQGARSRTCPANQSPDAHKGHVREFGAPPQPSAPAALSSSELAKELDSFAAAEPDAPAAAASPADETAAADKEDVNAYLAQLQADVKVEAHH